MKGSPRNRAPGRTTTRIVAYCVEVFTRTGFTPSYSMIADDLGICDRSTVRQYVKRAEAHQLLWLDEYRGGRGPRQGQRIRLGRPDEAGMVKIKRGDEL